MTAYNQLAFEPRAADSQPWTILARLKSGTDLPFPSYPDATSAWFFVRAALYRPFAIYPGRGMNVPTGFTMRVPGEWEAQARFITPLVTATVVAGQLDVSELTIRLHNTGTESFSVEHGDIIARIVFVRVTRMTIIEAL